MSRASELRRYASSFLVVGGLVALLYGASGAAPDTDAASIEQLRIEADVSHGARAQLEALAHSGIPAAQRAWGEVLAASPERPRAQEAIDWLTRAMRAGDAQAALSLGKLHLADLPGLARDPARAIAAFETGARTGHAGCAYYLGRMYRTGEGVAPDPARAARWLGVAAEQGLPAAMFMLANAYRDGEGVPRDEARALAWYEAAGEKEHPEAIQALVLAHQYGELGLRPDGEAARHAAVELAHALKHPALNP